jgi:hypothetical protein
LFSSLVLFFLLYDLLVWYEWYEGNMLLSMNADADADGCDWSGGWSGGCCWIGGRDKYDFWDYVFLFYV